MAAKLVDRRPRPRKVASASARERFMICLLFVSRLIDFSEGTLPFCATGMLRTLDPSCCYCLGLAIIEWHIARAFSRCSGYSSSTVIHQYFNWERMIDHVTAIVRVGRARQVAQGPLASLAGASSVYCPGSFRRQPAYLTEGASPALR